MAGYEWAHQMFGDILTPVAPGEPEPDGVRGLITRGWMAVVRLQMRVTALAPADLSLYQKLTSKTFTAGRYGVRKLVVNYRLPDTFAAMVKAAVDSNSKSRAGSLQHTILVHSHALNFIQMLRQSSNEKTTQRRFRQLLERGSTSLLTATPSGPLFKVVGGAFALAMRSRLGLPCLMGVRPDIGADESITRCQRAVNARHDAARDTILEVAMYSDMIVQEEPAGVYRCQHGTTREVTPDGALQSEFGWNVVFDVTVSSGAMLPLHIWNTKVYGHGTPAERAAAQRRSKEVRQQTRRMERAGHISAALGARRRLAAEVAVSDAYHPGYKAPCEMRGDRFFPVILTNHGGWYYHSSDFMMEVTHSGDKADSFNIEAERFDHYSRTWASWQHSAFLMQAVSCTMAQAAYVAMVTQSKKDLAAESGGRSSFESYGRSAGVQPPSPRVNRP